MGENGKYSIAERKILYLTWTLLISTEKHDCDMYCTKSQKKLKQNDEADNISTEKSICSKQTPSNNTDSPLWWISFLGTIREHIE